MGVIYVEGNYKTASALSRIHQTNETQNNRLKKLEAILDGSDGSVDNPEILNALIQSNTEKITNNTADIQSLNDKIDKLQLGGADLSNYYTKNEIDDKSFVTTEPTNEEIPDVPEYITRTDLDNAIAEAITNTINTPV